MFVSKSQILLQANTVGSWSDTCIRLPLSFMPKPSFWTMFTACAHNCEVLLPTLSSHRSSLLSNANISSWSGCLYQDYKHRNKSRKMWNSFQFEEKKKKMWRPITKGVQTSSYSKNQHLKKKKKPQSFLKGKCPKSVDLDN